MISQFQLWNHVLASGKPQHGISSRCENQAFLTTSILKFSFLSSSMFALLFENMLPKSNGYANIQIIASLFWIRNIFSNSAHYIFRKYWKEYYTLSQDVILEK